jgi:hypothetical protein
MEICVFKQNLEKCLGGTAGSKSSTAEASRE